MSEPVHGPAARRLLGNTAVLAAGQAVVRVASLIAFPLLTNSVEPKTYALYLYALQLAAAWAVLANFQLKAPLLRELTQPDGRRGETVAQVLTLRLTFSALVLLPTTLWCLHHFVTPRERTVFMLLLAANLCLAVGATFDEALQALEAFRLSALTAVAQGLTVSGGIIVGVLVGRPIAWAVGAQVVGAVVSLVLGAWFARRLIGEPLWRWRWSSTHVRELLRLAVGVAAAAQIGAWYGRLDLIFVERLMSETRLGQYGVAYRAVEVAMAGAMTVHTALLPMLGRAQAAGREALAPRLVTVLRIGLLLFVPFCTLVSCLSPVIMLIFKPDYAPAAGPLRILIWMTLIVFVNAVLHWVLYFHQRPWRPFAALVVGLVVNLALCQVLIPRHGLTGAAAARTAAELAIFGLTVFQLRPFVPIPWPKLLFKPALLAALMLGAWHLHPAGPWWLRALLSLAAYLLGLKLLQPLEPREADLLKSLRKR